MTEDTGQSRQMFGPSTLSLTTTHQNEATQAGTGRVWLGGVHRITVHNTIGVGYRVLDQISWRGED